MSVIGLTEALTKYEAGFTDLKQGNAFERWERLLKSCIETNRFVVGEDGEEKPYSF